MKSLRKSKIANIWSVLLPLLVLSIDAFPATGANAAKRAPKSEHVDPYHGLSPVYAGPFAAPKGPVIGPHVQFDSIRTSITMFPSSIIVPEDEDRETTRLSPEELIPETITETMTASTSTTVPPDDLKWEPSAFFKSEKIKFMPKTSRYRKLPFRPPKLKYIKNSTNATISDRTRKARVAYASFVKARRTNETFGADVSRNMKNRTDNSIKTLPQKGEDIFELSSSENKPSVFHQVHKRPKGLQRLYIGRIIARPNKTTSVDLYPAPNSAKAIPKLLLPKFHRPAMYSLDGYIPKPNLQRLTTTTTEAPATNRFRKFNQNRAKNLKAALVEEPNKRRKFGSRRQQELSDGPEDLSTSDSNSKRRISAFSKRRGFMASPVNQQGSGSRAKSGARKGVAGDDFPTLHVIPKTTFECAKHAPSGVFADPEAGCQVWHMCQNLRKHSFLCPNGTIFSEKAGVCDWWYNVDCPKPAEVLLLKEEKSSGHKKVTRRGRRIG